MNLSVPWTVLSGRILLDQLRGILNHTGIPAIYVTHDQEEAFTIADRVLMLQAGEIVREGTPSEVWAHPGSAWAAEFLGLGNVIEGSCKSRVEKSKAWKVDTTFGSFDVKCSINIRQVIKSICLARPLQAEAWECDQRPCCRRDFSTRSV